MWWPLQQQMNGLVPFVCVSGWGCSPQCRWKSSPHCIPNRWWRDAGTGCCPGRWWTGAAYELHYSCSGCWMHSACGSSGRNLQGAACIIIPARGRQDGFIFGSLTVTFEPLSDESKQHLSAVVAEGRSSVRVHVERMRTNLEIFKGGCSWKELQRKSEVTVGGTIQSACMRD